MKAGQLNSIKLEDIMNHHNLNKVYFTFYIIQKNLISKFLIYQLIESIDSNWLRFEYW